MLSAKKESFIPFFPNCIPSISFSYLIMLVRTSRTMLKSCGERRYTSLVSTLNGKAFSLSPLSIMSAVGFLWLFFINLKKFLLIILCREFLSWMGLGFLSNVYFCICWYAHVSITWCFFFSLLIRLITLVDFLMLNQTCMTWDKSHLVVVYNSFYKLLDWIC